MLRAMLTSNAPLQRVRICTYGRTDGLTQKVVTSGDRIAFGNAREKHPKSASDDDRRPCICTDNLPECPRNCLLRWF